jgi:hypothetical protein
LQPIEESMFFFEKKNQETFGLGHTWPGERTRQRPKVFCFFSSEKKILLESRMGATAADGVHNPARHGMLCIDQSNPGL